MALYSTTLRRCVSYTIQRNGKLKADPIHTHGLLYLVVASPRSVVCLVLVGDFDNENMFDCRAVAWFVVTAPTRASWLL
jgi:hypothetical protein